MLGHQVGMWFTCGVSCVYKRDGKGSDVSDPSDIERVFWMPSVRSQSRLECQRSVFQADECTVPGVMPHVRLWLQRWYR